MHCRWSELISDPRIGFKRAFRGPGYFIFLFLPTWDPLVISMKDYTHVWLTSWHICGTHLCGPYCSFSYSHMSSVYISQLQTGKFKARWAWRRCQWQPVGLTVWEANSNLSLWVYLQDTTLHELRQRDRGRCASRGWHKPTSTFSLKNRGGLKKMDLETFILKQARNLCNSATL